MSDPLHHPITWGPCSDGCDPPIVDVCDHCLDLSGDHRMCAWPCPTVAAGWSPPAVTLDPRNLTRVTLVDWRTGGLGTLVEVTGVAVQLDVQDEGRTLKVFLRDPTDVSPDPKEHQ